jgi:hypothetical protein
MCAVDGSACQTHAGESCGTSCSTDRRASLGAGTCDGSGACVQASTPCTVGYLCTGGACVAPGTCTSNSDCDGANSYTCSTTGNCEQPPPAH